MLLLPPLLPPLLLLGLPSIPLLLLFLPMSLIRLLTLHASQKDFNLFGFAIKANEGGEIIVYMSFENKENRMCASLV